MKIKNVRIVGFTTSVNLDEANHIYNHPDFFKAVYDLDLQPPSSGAMTVFIHHHLTPVEESKIITYTDTEGRIIWENYEERKLRKLLMAEFPYTKASYQFGYIQGTSSSFGSQKGGISASRIAGYEMWQIISIEE